MTEIVGGREVEPHAAVEVEVGWKLVYGGGVHRVMDKRVDVKLPWQDERVVWLLIAGLGWTKGGEGQTIYKLIEETPA